MHFNLKIISLLLIVFFIGCDYNKEFKRIVDPNTIEIDCGAEKWEGERFVDKSGKFTLSNAKGRTTEEKRSGDYCLKLTKEVPYGMTIDIDSIKPDEFFRITAWKKGIGHICASDNDRDGFFVATKDVVDSDSLGWEKLSLEFYVPHDYKKSQIRILLANFEDDIVYFDDLVIEYEKEKKYPSFNRDEVLNIFINDEDFQQLSNKRQKAIDQGILFTEDDDWVKAIIFYKDQVLDTRIRLKGDRLDHLQGKKWSFRIKIKGEESWKGMKTFSIQTPEARFMLHEWLFHKALEKEDILCTRYDFVPVYINGESVGVYAWEEHFEKQLIESRKRREGPILKLSDDSYWIYDMLHSQRKLDFEIPSYDASVIMQFGKGSLMKDSLLMNEFINGQNLYQQYKYAKGQASDIFNLEAIAKYYAMTDATNAYHTLHFFNQRFYYNPVLDKLEPIFFDSFPYNGIFDFDGSDLIPEKSENVWSNIHLKLFSDIKFKKLYFKYLEKYSSREFWEDIYNENKNEIRTLNLLLEKEFPNYHFNMNTYYKIAEEARIAMKSLEKQDEDKKLFGKFRDRPFAFNTYYKGKADFELLPHLINVYKQNEFTYHVENYTTDSIHIIGFGNTPEFESEDLEKEILLPQLNSKMKFSTDIQSKKSNPQYLFVEIRNKKVSIPVIPWKAPNEKQNFQDVLHSFNLEELLNNNSVYKSNDTLIFRGKITLSHHLVIPNGWKVVFEKGTELDLINSATFISYSPIFVNGIENSPVIFKSSDHTGKGINVFQVKTRSKVQNAVFTDLANLRFGGWLTTSSVCFYEADVDFENVKFENNYKCDDALNVVRSTFNLKNCLFENTFADAFDSDFSTGVISSTRFVSAGNDAIDLSGSDVLIENCTVIDSEDKGVSCGEQSKITIKGCNFKGGNIGIAAKDNSEVRIEDSEISYVNYGLVAFCKKPEYGPAKITTKNLILKKYIYLHLIEEGSNLQFNNREIFGQEKNLAKRFY